MVANREGWEGMDWEFEISRCKLLYIEWINSKILLYSTGTYTQYPVIRDFLVDQLRFRTSNAGGTGWTPGHGTKISYASQHRQKIKKDKRK